MAVAPRQQTSAQTTRRARAFRWSAVAAAAGVVIGGVSMFSTGTAGAATTATWNRLAGCESGGDWHINTGNGYYGGLQFSQGTWVAMGGTKYAARADLATPQEQMDIGENLLEANHWSWRAWPACSAKLHLTEQEARETDGMVDGVFEHGYTYIPTQRVPNNKPLRKLTLH